MAFKQNFNFFQNFVFLYWNFFRKEVKNYKFSYNTNGRTAPIETSLKRISYFIGPFLETTQWKNLKKNHQTVPIKYLAHKIPSIPVYISALVVHVLRMVSASQQSLLDAIKVERFNGQMMKITINSVHPKIHLFTLYAP